MESGKIEQFKKRFNPENLKIDTRIIVFVFFLMLSTILWFLNALNREYITMVSYHVKFVNFPVDMVLINDLPQELDFQVKSDGYNLLKYKLSPGIVPVHINVGELNFRQDEFRDSDSFYVLTNSIRDLIANQLSTDIQLLAIEPDSLIFNLSEVIHKKVKVMPDISYTIQKQYMLKTAVKTEPDSIIIKGPENILDTLSRIKTRNVSFEKLDKTITREIPLNRIQYVNYSASQVSITIPIEQFTESSIKVPISVVNLPDTLDIKTFPRDVSISFLVGLTDYERITESMFKPVIDFNTINLESTENRAEVKMSEYPGFIRSLEYYPKQVEFILEK